MAKGVPKKQKKGQPPPVDKLLKPAIGVALALIGYQFIRGLGSGITRISLIDEADLRDVFFGESNTGKSYAVLCQSEDSTAPISSVFNDAFKEGGSPAQFRVVDCEALLPTSGKSIAERFKLNLKQRPTIFVSGAVGPPEQVPDKHLKTGNMLTKYLRGKLEKRAAKIETTQDLRTQCLDKEVCALLLKGGKKPSSAVKDAMGKLLKEYPDIAFASVDASVLYTLHLEEFLPEFVKDVARFVVFRKVSGSMDAKASRLITSMATVEPATYGPMSTLISEVIQKTATMTKLSSLPQIKTRTKKLEESERAKRQRKAEQKRREAEGASSGSSDGSSSSSSPESDDIKEERRRERERRRAEHNEKNNVKPKTPEEIAEMERRRRERMEQEAAKWNMAPDDAPDQGDPVDGESYDMNEDDEDGGETVVIEDAQDEDDEDVIDLD